MMPEEAARSEKERPSTVTEAPEIHAHFTWTVEELLAARRLHGLHTFRRPFRYGGVAILVLAFIAGCGGIYYEGPSVPNILMTLVPIYIAFFRRYDQRWATKRQFRERPDKDARLDWTFTSAGMKLVSSEGSKSEMPWTAFIKTVISSQGVLLYPISEVFFWIPSHAFESDSSFQEFISAVRKRVQKTHETHA